MSNERVRWLFVTPEDAPSPPGAFVGVVTSEGDFQLHLCYERAQVRAIFEAAPGTGADIIAKSLQILNGSSLPDRSDLSESVIRGWAAEFIMEQFTGESSVLNEEDIDDFIEVESGYSFVVPNEGSGTEAILSEHSDEMIRVWVLPSRAAARHKLASVRAYADEAVYQDCLTDIDKSPLPEEDDTREMICIDGGLGALLALAIFCNTQREERENEFDA